MTTIIFRTIVRLVVPAVIVVALYLLWRGHDAPGGGFIAALVAGAALILQRYAGEALPPRTGGFATLVGWGLLLAVGTGIAGIVLTGTMFGPQVWYLPIPLLGELKVTLSFVFDIGVFLVVLAVINAIVDEIGFGDVDPRLAGPGWEAGTPHQAGSETEGRR
jgi:multicomponent Na+:H+ antiporter subunit A